MIAMIMFIAMTVATAAGVLMGFAIGSYRTTGALKLARYLEAIALADDLVKTPDALDLRDRAQKLLAAHRAAKPERGNGSCSS